MSKLLLELHWAKIPESGVQAFAIVPNLNVFKDGCSCQCMSCELTGDTFSILPTEREIYILEVVHGYITVVTDFCSKVRCKRIVTQVTTPTEPAGSMIYTMFEITTRNGPFEDRINLKQQKTT